MPLNLRPISFWLLGACKQQHRKSGYDAFLHVTCIRHVYVLWAGKARSDASMVGNISSGNNHLAISISKCPLSLSLSIIQRVSIYLVWACITLFYKKWHKGIWYLYSLLSFARRIDSSNPTNVYVAWRWKKKSQLSPVPGGLYGYRRRKVLRWLGSLYAECNQVRQTLRKKGVYGIECIERRWRITVCSAKPTDGISWRGRDLAIVMFTRRISEDAEYGWMLGCYLMKQIQSESKAKNVRWPVKLGPRSALSMECMVRIG